MCGIWALFGSTEDVAQLYNNSLKIRHRGPDAFRIENIHHLKNCCFGFHHLAIRDGLTGMQPLHLTSHPHIWLMMNGEIYNDLLLKEDYGFEYETKSDGEVIIHLYKRGGIEMVGRNLDGVFAFVLLDTKERKVFIGRDLYGVKPAFRLHTPENCLAVCSEAKGLIDLEYGSCDRIEQFPSGNVEEYDLSTAGLAVFNRRFQFNDVGNVPSFRTIAPLLGNEITTNIRNLMSAAITKRLVSVRRIGCFLSGGFDSSIVAALMVKHMREAGHKYPLQTFSIGMSGSADITAARKVGHTIEVADHIGSEHHEVIFSPSDAIAILDEVIKAAEFYDPMVLRACLAQYLLCRYIATKTDTIVVFCGEGADELAQGYSEFSALPTAHARDVHSRKFLKNLPYMECLRVDRMTSVWGLEGRIPFLDYELTAYYLSLPADVRNAVNNCEKFLLRKAFENTGLLPDEILWRTKACFGDGVSPVGATWSNILRQHANSLISDESLKEAPNKYPVNTPKAKDEYLCRTIFEKHYPGRGYWLPSMYYPGISNK